VTVDSTGLEQRLHGNAADRVPVPPDDLAGRVGSQLGDQFLEIGMRAKQCIMRTLDAHRSSTRWRLRKSRWWRWSAGACDPRVSFRRKRVLDFGCGVGRLMRHFVEEARQCEFWASDIHRPSIEWLERHLVPPFRVVVNERDPPLPFAEDYFDLVMALSVFTHLTDSWEPWLVELRRIIKPGGLALITFHHKAAYESICGRPFDEARVGMEVCHQDQAWERGGPFVFHSEWWVREHWGRVMPVEQIVPAAMDNWQSIALLRKPPRPWMETMKAGARRILSRLEQPLRPTAVRSMRRHDRDFS